MKFRGVSGKDNPELNMTSLIDVVLLLLIFFMLTTTFIRPSQLAIQLPESDSRSEAPPVARELEISVTSRGEFRVNGRPLVDRQRETLATAIRQVKPDVDGRHAVITADGRASHQDVVTAMDAAGREGFVEIRITTVRASPDDR